MKENSNILNVSKLSFAYDKNSKFNLNNINIAFKPGKIYAILGQNGSGKSTLLNCLSNYIKSYDGEILYKDTINITKLKDKERAKIISLVPQLNIGNALNIYDFVMLGRKPYIDVAPMMVDHEMASRAIDLFNLNKLTLKKTSELSGGELQSVSIARAFAQNSPIMLLDEPTNNLDVKKQRELFNILNNLTKNKSLCIICVLHDINQAMKYADELIFMKNGKIIQSGNKKIVTKKLLNKVYDVDAEIINNKNLKYIIV